MSLKLKPDTYYAVCADRGHVFMAKIDLGDEKKGDGTLDPDGITLYDAAIVRKWGTTKGLGQLCLEGRQADTVTDPIGVVFIPTHAVIYLAEAHAWPGLKADGTPWKDYPYADGSSRG